MTGKDPSLLIWWLISRASGIVALGLITAAVLIGLSLSSKVLRRPGLGKRLMALHEQVALVAFGAISLHGFALLGDHWLHPGLKGITVPFALGYRPLFTGLGIVAGYLAALLGLSFYLRRRIGVRVWRRMHRAILLVWVLAVVHTLGSGSDASSLWLRAFVLLPAVPIAYLFVLRLFAGSPAAGGRRPAPRPAAGASPAVARHRDATEPPGDHKPIRPELARELL